MGGLPASVKTQEPISTQSCPAGAVLGAQPWRPVRLGKNALRFKVGTREIRAQGARGDFCDDLDNSVREMRMLVENADDQTAADPSLLRILARAHHIQARLIQNPKLTVQYIAREEQVSAAYLFSLLRLPWLAPDITTAIINGRKPPQLTARTLMRLTPRLPAGWAEQRKLLGFR
jgi:hypothetical protein